eukprot:1720158-Rhodomonas_salina.1
MPVPGYPSRYQVPTRLHSEHAATAAAVAAAVVADITAGLLSLTVALAEGNQEAAKAGAAAQAE